MAATPDVGSDRPRKFRVTIRLEHLRRNLSAADGMEYTDADVRRWLRDAGFEAIGEGRWIVDEPNLGHLDPAEVEELVPVDPA
jgi:hypothetical protein